MYLLEFFYQLYISQSIKQEDLVKNLCEMEERAKSVVDKNKEHIHVVEKMLTKLVSSLSGESAVISFHLHASVPVATASNL